MSKEIVLFDGDCSMCRSLAGLVGRRSHGEIGVQSWQEFRETEEAKVKLPADVVAAGADVLRVWTGEELLAADEAWRFLLGKYRDLKVLGWMAAKLGLEKQAAVAIDRGSRAFRRICWRCPGVGRR